MTRLGLAHLTRTKNKQNQEGFGTDPSQFIIPESFTDVLYLTNQPSMPPEIKRLLKRKRLSYLVTSIDDFQKLLHRLDLIGTVIIDAKGLDISHQPKLARIIESLEMSNIGTILLNHRIKVPVKSFSLAGPPVKSFSLATTMDSISLDELWVRISINLACRRKGAESSFRSVMPPLQMEDSRPNRLAEKLQLTGALVDNLAEQLRMAGLVQRDFLPIRLPESDRLQWATLFMPAEWVSGDIYDVARIDERYIGFYVADAVGHAMPAALLTIFLKQALVMRETTRDSYRIFTPAEVMKGLNQRVAQQKLSGYQFATCCYCLLDTQSLELTYARAGHPYPILIRPGQEPMLLEAAGALLGIFDQSEYEQKTIKLQPGDKLLVYSDGAEPLIGSFSEATGFIFSEDFKRIRDLPVVQMMDELNQLAAGKKLTPCEIDDITAVALEVLK